jgi:hypothetical protein
MGLNSGFILENEDVIDFLGEVCSESSPFISPIVLSANLSFYFFIFFLLFYSF